MMCVRPSSVATHTNGAAARLRGPSADAKRLITIANTAIAIPCSCAGNVWRRIACWVGCNAPPPSP